MEIDADSSAKPQVRSKVEKEGKDIKQDSKDMDTTKAAQSSTFPVKAAFRCLPLSKPTLKASALPCPTLKSSKSPQLQEQQINMSGQATTSSTPTTLEQAISLLAMINGATSTSATSVTAHR